MTSEVLLFPARGVVPDRGADDASLEGRGGVRMKDWGE